MNKEIKQSDAPAIRLVDAILQKAIASHASDIHLESTAKGLRIRFRIDGMLYDQETIEAVLMSHLLSRIKVLANINIAEKRVPQDGKFRTVADGHDIDLRISTFPSIYGEKIVIRILDRSLNKITLDALGMYDSMLQQFKELLMRPHGFFLVTGPTGSGKTTTLYAALSALNAPEKNIITLEDPVEYSVDGITQGHINPEAGFTFSKGIRSILRQDPDILMVGEIRDKETARTAIEAALTGHMVLSTLHTNDAPSAIMRLMDMGIEPFLINAAVTGVLAQRLARKICVACRTAVRPDEQEQQILQRVGLKVDQLYKGKGCDTCLNLGYKGRTGIFEFLTMTNALRALIVHRPQFDAIYAQALQDGMPTMLHDGAQKVKDGIITLEELIRVVV
ncbi:MAG: GspE/PulE family protein [Candidatus Dependentiae bacterium]|nr:GspE/PulE family protein [Candidatus Dependentiae bacterium]